MLWLDPLAWTVIAIVLCIIIKHYKHRYYQKLINLHTCNYRSLRPCVMRKTWTALCHQAFLSLMAAIKHVNAVFNVELPLPIIYKHDPLPTNKYPVFYRTRAKLSRIQNETPEILLLCIDLMQKSIDNVEQVPIAEEDTLPGESWYRHLLCVFHQPKDKIRLVDDESTKYKTTA